MKYFLMLTSHTKLYNKNMKIYFNVKVLLMYSVNHGVSSRRFCYVLSVFLQMSL